MKKARNCIDAVLVIITIVLFIIYPFENFLVLIGCILALYGVLDFSITTKNNELNRRTSSRSILFILVGATLVFKFRPNTDILLQVFFNQFDFVKAFEIGSFSLIISSILYKTGDGKEARNALILSSISCLFFFVAGFILSMAALFSNIESNILSELFSGYYKPIVASFVLLSVFSLVVASASFATNVIDKNPLKNSKKH